MNHQKAGLLGAVCLTLFCLTAAKGQIIPMPLTAEELAETLGVKPLCAQVHFAEPRYARLAVNITDAEGIRREYVTFSIPATDLRLRVLLVSIPGTDQPQRLCLYIGDRPDEHGSAARFVYFRKDFSRNQGLQQPSLLA